MNNNLITPLKQMVYNQRNACCIIQFMTSSIAQRHGYKVILTSTITVQQAGNDGVNLRFDYREPLKTPKSRLAAEAKAELTKVNDRSK
jgi:hypothetical protein